MDLCTAKSLIIHSLSPSLLRFRKKDVFTPMEIHISVYEDHLNEGFREKPPLVSVVVERWYIVPGIQRVHVTEKGLKGTFYIPPGITDRGLDICCCCLGMSLGVLIVLVSQMFLVQYCVSDFCMC